VGGKFLTEYRAANNASRPTAGTAIYNVTPAKAGRYFHKIACFCFDEQTLAAGQEMRMPVSFFLDPSLMADDNMDDVTEITLSYTFFPAKSAELEEAKANNPPPQIEYDPNRYN
jgi:cytochrome c oxidase assembly protein subunit 11